MSSSSSKKLPAYASFAAQALIPPPLQSPSSLESELKSELQSELKSPRPLNPLRQSISNPPSSQPSTSGPPPRRRVKKRRQGYSSVQSLIRSLARLIAHWIRTTKDDPALGVMAVVAIGLCGILGHRLISAQFPTPPPVESSGFKLPPSKKSPSADFAPTEAALPADFETKLRSLNVSSDWFSATVTELTSDAIAPQDPRWKDRATLLLKTVEALPPESRRDIGTYRRANLDTWLRAAQPTQKPEVLSKQVEDATDAEFFKAFPDRRGTALNPRNLGQIWYAIARTETAKLKR